MAESNAGQGGEQASQQAYQKGMEAYATACSLSSSEQGDDLPGLLHNWGVGLRSMAEHTPVRPSSVASCIHRQIVCLSNGAGFACYDIALYVTWCLSIQCGNCLPVTWHVVMQSCLTTPTAFTQK